MMSSPRVIVLYDGGKETRSALGHHVRAQHVKVCLWWSSHSRMIAIAIKIIKT